MSNEPNQNDIIRTRNRSIVPDKKKILSMMNASMDPPNFKNSFKNNSKRSISIEELKLEKNSTQQTLKPD